MRIVWRSRGWSRLWSAGSGVLLTLFLAASFVGGPMILGADADPKAKAKAKAKDAFPGAPKPATALQTAVKNLLKSKSYHVSVDIVGGFSEKEDHAVTDRKVAEAYEADVHGALMYVPSPKAYRTLKKGVAYIEGAWRGILSSTPTTILDRLFLFPEKVLGNALKHAPRSAKWCEVQPPPPAPPIPVYDPSVVDDDAEDPDASADRGSSGGGDTTASDKPASGKSASGKTAVGKTVVGKTPAKGKSAVDPSTLPRLLRVDSPSEEALELITAVQNSNCFGGG
jgi:hypothetical protein